MQKYFTKIEKIKVFGSNWPTPDGTGIRDYIHVMDLAEGHLSALNYLINNNPRIITLNLGTGIGTSVLDLINTFEKVNNVEIPYVFTSRREGDQGIVVADNSLIKRELKWEPKYNLDDMCTDGWNWTTLNPFGF